MKKFTFALMLCLAVAVLLAGCGNIENSSSLPQGSAALALADKYENEYTEENFPVQTVGAQKIIDKYFNPYAVTGLFQLQFEAGAPLENYDTDVLLAVFDVLCHTTQSESFNTQLAQFEGEIPQEYVEGVLTTFLPLEPDDVRSICAQQYNLQSQSYTHYSGLGGGPSLFIIDKAEQAGSDITIDYIIYGANPGASEGVVFNPYLMGTLKLRESGESFSFISNSSTRLPDKLPQ